MPDDVYGFGSLGLAVREPCRPCDARRDGISIAEAAGFALLERPEASEGPWRPGRRRKRDAHHMSAPHPQGRARISHARLRSTARASLPAAIDYVNMHGTATPANDRTEDGPSIASSVIPMPCSSTKGWTGHALGAAGITEAAICGDLPGAWLHARAASTSATLDSD